MVRQVVPVELSALPPPLPPTPFPSHSSPPPTNLSSLFSPSSFSFSRSSPPVPFSVRALQFAFTYARAGRMFYPRRHKYLENLRFLRFLRHVACNRRNYPGSNCTRIPGRPGTPRGASSRPILCTASQPSSTEEPRAPALQINCETFIIISYNLYYNCVKSVLTWNMRLYDCIVRASRLNLLYVYSGTFCIRVAYYLTLKFNLVCIVRLSTSAKRS